MKYKVVVTQDDIRKGTRNDYEACPIARALCRQMPIFAGDIIVEGDTARVGGRTFDLPVEAQRFIERFDGEQTAKPFSFLLIYGE